MKYFVKYILICLLTSFYSMSVFATQVTWTDWISSANNTSAAGQLLIDSTTVNVDYSATGGHSFVQTGSTGTDYWASGSPYTNGVVENDPTAKEMIALSQGGTVTINFSETIKNPFIGLISWNSNTVDFGVPITIDSFGPGHWGNGTPILNSSGTGFFGNGEVHGVISLQGSFDSISFSHTTENWHGFTVGVEGLAPVPVPAAIWLLGSGIFGLLGMRRKLPITPA